MDCFVVLFFEVCYVAFIQEKGQTKGCQKNRPRLVFSFEKSHNFSGLNDGLIIAKTLKKRQYIEGIFFEKKEFVG